MIRPYRYLARVSVETASPLSIGSGEPDPRFDVLLVRDANDLPCLPATALAGILRRAVGKPVVGSNEAVDLGTALFGQARQAREDYVEGMIEASPVRLTWGCLHDSSDRPVDGLRLGGLSELAKDDVLADALDIQPVKRDHVRLTGQGVAKDRGKFDRGALSVGHRFTFDLEYRSSTENDPHWTRLLDCLSAGSLRLGGGTRRGYGHLKVFRLHTMTVDLTGNGAVDRYLSWPSRLDGQLPSEASAVPLEPGRQAPGTIGVVLQPDDFWRVGGGSEPVSTGKRPREQDTAQPQLLPVTEPCIDWAETGGSATGRPGERARLVIPASGIKGALRHRTVFHFNRFEQQFGDDPGKIAAFEQPPEIDALFGYVREPEPGTEATDGEGGENARAGFVSVRDGILEEEPSYGELWHNGIDRFTGGVRSGVLYGEQLAYGGKIRLAIDVEDVGESGNVGDQARKAFAAALDDLCTGRLPIGAGAAKGHGYVTGEILSADKLKKWVETGEISR